MSITIRRKRAARARLDLVIQRALNLDGLVDAARRVVEHMLYPVRSRSGWPPSTTRSTWPCGGVRSAAWVVSKDLAWAIVATRLGRLFEEEDFWRTGVHFFVNHPELGLEHVGPIVGYLHAQRFDAPGDLVEEGELSDEPPQPGLSTKGRTPRSLLRQVGEWHARLRRLPPERALRWGPSGIGAFRWEEPQDGRPGDRCWTIRELLSSGALYREGTAIGHCVATFARACARREASIWSMRFEVPGRRYRALTIEVDPRSRTIRQARRHHDAFPTQKHRRILERWAVQEGLTIGM